MKHLNWKKAVIILLAFFLAFAGARTYFWMRGTLGPDQFAMNALQSDENVQVTQEKGIIVFETGSQENTTGFIFYPGAGVDYRSYAPALRQIAQQGFHVFLPSMPFNLAFFNANAARKIINNNPQILNWVIGGHSLGGVLASSFAAEHPIIKGMVFWASFPKDGALKMTDIKVLSISASLDGLATPSKINRSRVLLPADTLFVEIIGGNHAQFGAYGSQSGDNPPSISFLQQTEQIVNATTSFLAALSN